MINARQLVKRFGDKTAVGWLDLGPSSAGSSALGGSTSALPGEPS